ncbi:MAG: hypothetical protein IKB72_04080 [Ruminococcus sp.]|nr:hypothetical protein [Ruminococcus sp.]
MLAEIFGFIKNIWTENTSFEWWQILLISFFFLMCNTVLFFALWLLSKWSITEYGYPKRKSKYIKKHVTNDFTFFDHILLLKLAKRAKQKGFFLYLVLFLHWFTIGIFLCTCVAFCACLINNGQGWSVTLMILPMFGALILSAAILFIPQLIFLPAVRKQYKRKS